MTRQVLRDCRSYVSRYGKHLRLTRNTPGAKFQDFRILGLGSIGHVHNKLSHRDKSSNREKFSNPDKSSNLDKSLDPEILKSSNSRFRLIVFDLDGTLVDSRRDLAESANQLLQQCGDAELS